eukprot:NODE_739_length_4684_cov_0.601091.p3 type:complete len:131 gc:universal NODE_739_length_4684_cov_0.601091:1811-1419(-)
MLKRLTNLGNLVNREPIIPQPGIELLKRTALIYRPTKSAMQSGSEGTSNWRIKWDTEDTFENPLMGWNSSVDPLQAMRIKFESKDKAKSFCEKNGWNYEVQEPKEKKWKMKSYADNFKHSFGPLRQIKTK